MKQANRAAVAAARLAQSPSPSLFFPYGRAGGWSGPMRAAMWRYARRAVHAHTNCGPSHRRRRRRRQECGATKRAKHHTPTPLFGSLTESSALLLPLLMMRSSRLQKCFAVCCVRVKAPTYVDVFLSMCRASERVWKAIIISSSKTSLSSSTSSVCTIFSALPPCPPPPSSPAPAV